MFNIDKYNSKKYKEGSKRGLRGKAILNLSKKSKKINIVTWRFNNYIFILLLNNVISIFIITVNKKYIYKASFSSSNIYSNIIKF